MAPEEFVKLFVNLYEIQKKVVWRTDIPYVVLTTSLAFSVHDVEAVLRAMGVSLTTHKYDVELMRDATPLVVFPKSDYWPNKQRYPLRLYLMTPITD